jgi:hypothetical protein
MTSRRMLPQRRASQTFDITHGDQRGGFTVTIGFYADGAIGELFISGAKAGTAMDAVARDGAVLISIALQHDVPLETIRHAITREADGRASTIIGAALDELTECERYTRKEKT